MTAATKPSPAPRSPWAHSHKSTTPNGLPKPRTPASVGQSHAYRLNSSLRSPHKDDNPRSPSPNYFGLVVEPGVENPPDSNAGQHAKKNWKSPSSSIQSTVTPKSPVPVPDEHKPEYDEFKKQSEAYAFRLSSRNFSGYGQFSNNQVSSPLAEEITNSTNGEMLFIDENGSVSPKQAFQISSEPMEVDSGLEGEVLKTNGAGRDGFTDTSSVQTPESMSRVSSSSHLKEKLANTEDKHHLLSLPQDKVSMSFSQSDTFRRAENLPWSLPPDSFVLVNPLSLASLLDPLNADRVLLLDLRVSPQYSQSRLKGALNLCIPTTLLKRPSFNIQRLTDSFSDRAERAKFISWKDAGHIVVYDASSSTLKDAGICTNTLRKFTNEGYNGELLIIKGGFRAATTSLPHLVEEPNANSKSEIARKMSLQSENNSMPVAGGCPMPVAKSAANPFFGNIRQNMDLIGGVGQVSIKLPASLGPRGFQALPSWLRTATAQDDDGRTVSEIFLRIEKAEQSRMQKALSCDVSYGTPAASDANANIQIAGIEKGTKNRYKDMLPYDHARVRLQNEDESICDYVNASHVKAQWTNKRYIATQAPVPATFEDFWRVIWEQNVRVLVMLTAELDGNQRKCHPYWLADKYGPMKIKHLSEKRVSLQISDTLNSSFKRAQVRPSLESKPSTAFRRRATNPHGATVSRATQDNQQPDQSEPPYITVRTLALSHALHPFQPMREITQVQYTQWPDLGTPAHPTDLLALVEHTNLFARQYQETKSSSKNPASPSEPPILVHCSAGCGRTGTFCTIDSVIDMLKRQHLNRIAQNSDLENMEFCGDCRTQPVEESSWIMRDDIDLIEKAVEDFRLQRLSMVQTLKQFVMCYENVLEWLVREIPELFNKDAARRSFQG